MGGRCRSLPVGRCRSPRRASVPPQGRDKPAAADPDNNYRIPDLSYVAAGHASVIRKRGIVGPADAVIEIRSPDDETYEKFPFYARLGVGEIVVVHRDSRKPEVYRLAGKQYVAVAPAGDGWVTAEVLRIRLRPRTARKRATLEVRSLLDPRQRAGI